MAKEQILSTIKGYIFDKWPVHVLSLGVLVDNKLFLDKDTLKIFKPEVTGTTPSPEVVKVEEVITDKTLNDIFTALLTNGVNTAFTASFRQEEPVDSLIGASNVSMDNELRIYQRSFYSDTTILLFIKNYLINFLGYDTSISDPDIDNVLNEISGKAMDHLCLYVAIQLVDYRRIFAYAQQFFDGSTFSDGTGTDIGGSFGADGDSITVNIGEVFSLTDDEGRTAQYPSSDDGTQIGSENFFGDVNSFWYRLFLWLRDKLEQGFSDFTFRKNSGLWMRAKLDKPLSYYQYFDSYPFPDTTRQIREGLSR